MSGKPYSIGEFKIIVDYLVENKLYGEIKARKMWVDFANTKLTTRTWQSLKEAFLKRILPDIHNPYFRLTNEQISSFRSRCDLADRNRNKLDIHTISDDSSSNGLNPKDNEPSNDEGETTAGENKMCSKIPSRSRSSADTIILENCYETAEEIQKDLESTGSNEMPISKSLRDCITYSEPLTPMLQEVLDDFASEPEDSDREGRMEIVESVPDLDNSDEIRQILDPEISNTKSVTTDSAKDAKGPSSEVAKEAAQESKGGSKPENKSPTKTRNLTGEIEELPVINFDDEISSVRAENGTEKDDANAETLGTTKIITADNTLKPVVQNSENTEVDVANNSHSEPQVHSGGLNNSNSTVDASLPNNPEAFNKKQSKDIDTNKKEAPESAVEVSNNMDKTQIPMKATKKRSHSEDSLKSTDNKKKKLEIMLVSPSKKVTIESHVDTHAKDEPPKVNGNSNKPDIIKKPWLEENTRDLNKPSTSFETHVVDIIQTETRRETVESAEIVNPCLQNVSLFDEQFNKTNYNMSESSDTEQNKKETQVDDNPEPTVTTAAKEIVELKDDSESDTGEVNTPPKKKNRAGVLSTKSERDKAIANMFGFTSGGGVGSKRKRQLSRRRRTISHNNASHHNMPAAVSNSSDWESESESETYVSPPRSRKNRPTRKYLKPQAGKILSLEEEGGLFVMYGKKIYPLIKDGKIVKNYITYLPESDSEEGEAFWKQKYVEEKKKATELKKLLEQANEPQAQGTMSPILQANPLRNSRSSHHQPGESSNGVGKEVCLPGPSEKKEETKVNPPEKIKIKFTKNNEEVHLEGHWPQIHPVLEQVVQIFHKEVEPSVSETKSKMTLEAPNDSKEPSSGLSSPLVITPVDPEVREKVDKIEKEIFKEIEERDREEEYEPNESETNVTKRRSGRPRKSSSSTRSLEKQPKLSNGTETKESAENSRTRRQKAKETENKVIDNQEIVSKRQIRTPRKILNETVNMNDSKTIQTRRSKQKLDTSKNDDEEVRYMLPPRNKTQSLKAVAGKKTNQKPQKSSGKAPKKSSSPDNFSLNSMDSTQGYQDSDISPLKTEIKKKKKLDISSFMIKTRNSLRRSARRRSHPYLYCNAYNDSSNSSFDASVKVVARDNSSLNTDAYRTESYQLLMPRAKVSSRQLESIDETTPFGNETSFVKHLESICKNEISAQINNANRSGLMTSDVGSSSNVSLPMSPELSVVENMSISKEILNSIEDYPTINEIQSNETKEVTKCSQYKISDIDVSIPLMQQECELQSCNTIAEVSPEPKGLVSESLLNKIGTFNINDQVTATDTLDKKLHDLLLESAKKMTRAQSAEEKESMMEVDITSVEVQKKTKTNKNRCSTPQKRKVSKKSVAPKVDPVVEEEHVESCSHSGRKSCPPLLQTHLSNENVVNEEINIANLTIANEKPKGRKKKDIIRVKIQRPKHKIAEEKLRQSAQNASRLSVFTDSGINDTESDVFLRMNDSVDLIHNHSETCLHANECVGDSIEFVDNSKSVITLGDSMQSGDNAWNSRSVNDEHSTSPDLFCNNAQDVSFYNKANTDNTDSASETVYHSPLGTEASPNSLITEDLSDASPQPARPTNWYLLSEDTTNTNIVGQGSTMLSSGSFGSNLKQLFPIACAVPDLSTITEMSRENDNSRKPTLEDMDVLTAGDFNAQSIFDPNF